MPDSGHKKTTGTAKAVQGDQTKSYQRAMVERIDLIAHSGKWSDMAAAEINRLMNDLPNRFVQIRHVGSTAIPGLIAKDSIDLIAGLTDWGTVDAVISELRAQGYDYDAGANEELPGRRWLFRHKDGHRTHHLHLVAHNSQEWRDRVDFCELLKNNAMLRDQYAELKLQLASTHLDDRAAYSNGKSEFIQKALATIRN